MLPHIERYEITEEIGHGGMATVYRARDVRLERPVAVKVMHPHLRGEGEARARFSREARAVASLRHPAILEIYDYSGLDSDDAYIATELLTGPTLKDFADTTGELPPQVVACIGVELAGGLAAAHAEGIVHRDVKPENVLLHEDRCIKLTDFGIAGMLDPSASAMTATGQILGSPAHMAPEQITDGTADARSDVFALGTILYWLAVGELPFSGHNPHQILKRVVDQQPADPERRRPSLGRGLSHILLRCLSKDPADRYQSADALADDLREWLLELDVQDPHETLADYFGDRPVVGERLREQAIAALLRQAKTRVQAGERVPALEALDRVLALDDGNAAALALVRRLERAAQVRSLKRWGLIAAAMAAALGTVVLAWPEEDPVVAAVIDPQNPGPTSSLLPREPEAPLMSPPPAPSAAPSGPSEAAPKPAAVTAPPAPVVSRRPRRTGPRRIQFKPYPVNVSIGVDGGPLQVFGPNFTSVELEPGDHTFRFVGGRACCVDKVLKVDVPPGPGTTVLEPRLAFRPARLYVVSNVPADVDVSDGKAGGRSRSVINVPVERSLVEPHRISVTAPGYAPYTGRVSLRAGKVEQIRVTLQPSGTGP